LLHFNDVYYGPIVFDSSCNLNFMSLFLSSDRKQNRPAVRHDHAVQ